MSEDVADAPTFEVLTSADDQATREFCQRIWREMRWPEEHLSSSILKDYQESGDVFLILKQSEGVVACGGLLKLSSQEVLMKKFYVAQSLRGSDVAQQLFNELVKRARDGGYSWLVLDVTVENARAIRFYQKMHMDEYAVTPHPRWFQSSPAEHKNYRYFRMKL